jgi:inhibitor of cysteine peptidase
MIKKYVWLLLAPILLLSGCGGPKLTQINLEGKDVDYKIAEGTSFQVVLPSNQTTGYKWEVTDITSGVLEEVKNTYRVTQKYAENVVGAGGEEIWTFKVLKEERSHILMEYRKPWATSELANKFTTAS